MEAIEYIKTRSEEYPHPEKIDRNVKDKDGKNYFYYRVLNKFAHNQICVDCMDEGCGVDEKHTIYGNPLYGGFTCPFCGEDHFGGLRYIWIRDFEDLNYILYEYFINTLDMDYEECKYYLETFTEYLRDNDDVRQEMIKHIQNNAFDYKLDNTTRFYYNYMCDNITICDLTAYFAEELSEQFDDFDNIKEHMNKKDLECLTNPMNNNQYNFKRCLLLNIADYCYRKYQFKMFVSLLRNFFDDKTIEMCIRKRYQELSIYVLANVLKDNECISPKQFNKLINGLNKEVSDVSNESQKDSVCSKRKRDEQEHSDDAKRKRDD